MRWLRNWCSLNKLMFCYSDNNLWTETAASQKHNLSATASLYHFHFLSSLTSSLYSKRAVRLSRCVGEVPVDAVINSRETAHFITTVQAHNVASNLTLKHTILNRKSAAVLWLSQQKGSWLNLPGGWGPCVESACSPWASLGPPA